MQILVVEDDREQLEPFVQVHQGKIRVISEVGTGSTFRVTVPHTEAKLIKIFSRHCHYSVTIASYFKIINHTIRFLSMNNYLIVAGILASIVTTSLSVQAQTIPIEQLQQRQQGTTITGTVRSVVGNEFILSDGTGEVIVDAGPRWYRAINVSAGEQLTVTGEYDDDDFDAFTITRANGEVITIRNGPGRPPWAGKRD